MVVANRKDTRKLKLAVMFTLMLRRRRPQGGMDRTFLGEAGLATGPTASRSPR